MKKKSKNLLVLIVVLAIIGIGVGYAALSQTLTLNGTAKLAATSEWNVIFAETKDGESKSSFNATDSGTILSPTKPTMTATGTQGTFSATLAPGEKAIYDVYITNTGSIPADYDDYDITEPTNVYTDKNGLSAVTCTVDDSEVGSAISDNAEHHFTVTLDCPNALADLPSNDVTYSFTVDFNYVQAGTGSGSAGGGGQ